MVIIHGWGSSRKSWEGFLGAISSFENIKTYFIELPGFGQTAAPSYPWNIDDYANYVFEYIEKLKLRSFTILGHSFGGGVAVKFALLHPGYAQKMILCDAALIRQKQSFRQKLINFSAKIGKIIFSFPLLNKLRDLARRILYRAAGSKDYYLAKGVMRETFINALKEDLRPLLAAIKIPVLIIWGDKDDDTALLEGRFINRNISNSRLEIIKGAGHIPYKTHIKELIDLIKGFIKP